MADDAFSNVSFGEKTTISLGGSLISAARVISIDLPEVKRAKISTTAMGSTLKTNRKSRQYEQGDMKVTVWHDDTFAATVKAALASDTGSACVIKFFDSTDTAIETWTWAQAFVSEYKYSGSEEDKNLQLEFTLFFNDLAVVS